MAELLDHDLRISHDTGHNDRFGAHDTRPSHTFFARSRGLRRGGSKSTKKAQTQEECLANRRKRA